MNQLAVKTGQAATPTETEKKQLKRIRIPRDGSVQTASVTAPEKTANLADQLQRLSEMVEADPDDPELRRRLNATLRTMLDRDAFLDYQFQSEHFYRVRTGDGLTINVPKERASPPSFPNTASPALRTSMRLFRVALLGLLLAGVPTFFLTPIIMWRLLVALIMQPLPPGEKVQATTLMFSSFILFCVATLLSLLLVLHWVA